MLSIATVCYFACSLIFLYIHVRSFNRFAYNYTTLTSPTSTNQQCKTLSPFTKQKQFSWFHPLKASFSHIDGQQLGLPFTAPPSTETIVAMLDGEVGGTERKSFTSRKVIWCRSIFGSCDWMQTNVHRSDRIDCVDAYKACVTQGCWLMSSMRWRLIQFY